MGPTATLRIGGFRTMSHITMEVPERTRVALKIPVERLAEELRMVVAVKLYELGRLSSGAAAEMAGVPKPVFLGRLADYGVATFGLTGAQLDRETRLA